MPRKKNVSPVVETVPAPVANLPADLTALPVIPTAPVDDAPAETPEQPAQQEQAPAETAAPERAPEMHAALRRVVANVTAAYVIRYPGTDRHPQLQTAARRLLVQLLDAADRYGFQPDDASLIETVLLRFNAGWPVMGAADAADATEIACGIAWRLRWVHTI